MTRPVLASRWASDMSGPHIALACVLGFLAGGWLWLNLLDRFFGRAELCDDTFRLLAYLLFVVTIALLIAGFHNE